MNDDATRPDPAELLDEACRELLEAQHNRAKYHRSTASDDDGPTAALGAKLGEEAMADQGDALTTMRQVVPLILRTTEQQPAPSATAVTNELLDAAGLWKDARASDDEAEWMQAARALHDALDPPPPPALVPVSTYADIPLPAPVLWRDPGGKDSHDRDRPDAVLSVGEGSSAERRRRAR